MTRFKVALAATTCIIALASGAAGAQSAAVADAVPTGTPPAGTPQAGATSQPATVNDIIVTAQKRSERISDVGMAITAATGEQLRQQQVVSVGDLHRIEPSLQYSQSNNDTPVYTVRGIGYFEQSLSATPAVSVYQDEIAYTYPIMTKGALLDVDRVEVLKGPQGTLYGQNATGGAINFIANAPTSKFSAGGDLSFARFNALDLDGFVSGPITSTLNARVAFRTEQGGAWQRSDTDGRHLGDKDNLFVRALVDWRPTEKLKVRLNLNGWQDKSDSQAAQLVGVHFQSPAFISATTPTSGQPVQPYSQYPAHIQDILANTPAPRDDRAADWVSGTHPRDDERFYQASGRIDYAVSDALNLTLLSSYQNFRRNDFLDQSGINVADEGGLFRGHVKTWSEEARAGGFLLDRKINWLVGVNYDHTHTDEDVDLNEFFGSVSYLTGGSPESALPAFLNLGPTREIRTLNTDLAKTASVFADVEYHPTPALGIHGGVRYTRSDQDIGGCSIVYNPGFDLFINNISRLEGGSGNTASPGNCFTLGPDHNSGFQLFKLDQSNVPWRVGVDYKLAPRTLVYASVTKGFKAGSSPSLGAETYQQLQPVTQESVLSYEVGAKSTLFANTLQLNAAYFHYDYRNKQFLGRTTDPIFSTLQTLINVPRSQVDGIEASALWRPLPQLTFNGAVTWLRSRVTSSFFNYSSYAASPTDTINLKGEAFPFTPRWSLLGGARYEWPVRSGLNAFVSADGTYQSRTVSAFGAAEADREGPSLDIRSYATLNLSAGVETADKRWAFQVWGRNVTNTYYWTTAFYEADTTVRYAGQPATFGFTLSRRY